MTVATRTESSTRLLAVVLGGLFLVPLDVTIVNVATPDIASALGASSSQLVFVVAAYTLAFASLLIAGARWGDAHGHRRAFCAGLALFTIGSLACGLASGPVTLIAARVVQGAGGALMSPQVLSIMQLQIPPQDRARAFGLYGTVLAGGAVSGQVIGGAVLSADLLGTGWRAIFLLNVPIGLALVPIAWRLLAETQASRPRPVDVPGTVAMVGGVLMLVLAGVVGQQQGWPAWSFATLAGGVGVLSLGVTYLRRLPAGSGVIDVSIFGDRRVTSGFLCIFLGTAAYGGFVFTLGLFLQRNHGFSPLQSGLSFVPFAVGFAGASLGFARLRARADLAPALGLTAAAAAYVALALLVRGGHWPVAGTIVITAVAGGGFGLGFSPIFARALARVPPASSSDASGAIATIDQLGLVAGVAAFGGWFLAGDHSTPGDAGHTLAAIYIACAALSALAALAALATASGRVE